MKKLLLLFFCKFISCNPCPAQNVDTSVSIGDWSIASDTSSWLLIDDNTRTIIGYAIYDDEWRRIDWDLNTGELRISDDDRKRKK